MPNRGPKWTKEYSREYYRKWQAANRDKLRRYQLKHEYGITPEAYEQLKISQNGACAICKTVPKAALHVDHNHVTNKIRGLLCVKCNTGLGSFSDDTLRLRLAADYLEKYK